MNEIDEEEYDDDHDGDEDDDIIDDVVAADIELNFCNSALESDGVSSNGVTVNNEFNNVDDACKSDVDMADAAAICGTDVEGKPINGT